MLEPHSYRFRPGRAARGAAAAVKHGLGAGGAGRKDRRPRCRWVLDADIKSVFDEISHDAMLAHVPVFRDVIAGGLKAGGFTGGVLDPTEAGAPQGGVASPLPANIALHGLGDLLHEWSATGRGRDVAETVVIRQLVNFALSRDVLAVDPLKGPKLKKPKPTPQPCRTVDQVTAILADSPEEVRPALALLAETGMRFAELAWLTRDDVELTANVLRAQPKAGRRPKTRDQRAVPLSPTARRVVEGLPRRRQWAVTVPPSRKHPRPGRRWTERRLVAALKRVLGRLGLPGKLHTFRHAFISNALLNGPCRSAGDRIVHPRPQQRLAGGHAAPGGGEPATTAGGDVR